MLLLMNFVARFYLGIFYRMIYNFYSAKFVFHFILLIIFILWRIVFTVGYCLIVLVKIVEAHVLFCFSNEIVLKRKKCDAIFFLNCTFPPQHICDDMCKVVDMWMFVFEAHVQVFLNICGFCST